MRPGGTLLLMGGTGGRKISRELGIVSAAHRRAPAFRGRARARARPGPRQPDRRRLRRHAAVGLAARRRPGRAPRASCARRSRSGASSGRPTSPRSPFTSWPTPRSRARRTTSTAASSGAASGRRPQPQDAVVGLGGEAAAVAVAREHVERSRPGPRRRSAGGRSVPISSRWSRTTRPSRNTSRRSCVPRRHGEQVVAGPARAAAADERRAGRRDRLRGTRAAAR